MNNPEYIIIHHSATTDGTVRDWDAIRKYHIETNGWRDIGYHYGIENVNGEYVIQKGRNESEEGAHTVEQRMNFRSIGICLVGNFDTSPPPEPQLQKLYELIKDIYTRYNAQLPVRMHREFASYKSCPGNSFPIGNVIAQSNKIWSEMRNKVDIDWKEAIDEWSQRKLENGDPVIGFPVQWQAKMLGQLVDSESVRWLLKKTYKYIKEKGL